MMLEKVKNVAKKVADKMKKGWNKLKVAGIAAILGLAGLATSAVVFILIGSIIVTIACVVMSVLAFMSITLASVLGLSTGWAVMFFVAFVLLFWH